jgi:hypothetical protein
MSKRKSRNETTPARLPRYVGRTNVKRKPSKTKKSAQGRRDAPGPATRGQCDRIGVGRNRVLEVFNEMLRECRELPLPLIRLSSTQL